MRKYSVMEKNPQGKKDLYTSRIEETNLVTNECVYMSVSFIFLYIYAFPRAEVKTSFQFLS